MEKQTPTPVYMTVVKYAAFDKGTYDVELHSITPETMDFDDGKGIQERFAFGFIIEGDKSDDPRILKINTGRNFGSPKATLTKMAEGLTGNDIPLDLAPSLNLALLYGDKYRLSVDKSVSKNGNESNTLLLIERKSTPKKVDLKTLAGVQSS